MKLGKVVLALSFVVAGASAAFAEQAPFATYNVVLDTPFPRLESSNPILAEPPAKSNVAFRIQNNTGKALYFVGNNEKQYIPVVSERTVTTPYSTEDFKAVDEAGNTVATWRLQGGQVQEAKIKSATEAEFAEWGRKLQGVIESAQNRTVSYSSYQSQQPAAAASAAPSAPADEAGTTVRGYW